MKAGDLGRLEWVDSLRGAAITMMIAYHLIFDLWYFRIAEFNIDMLPLAIFQHSIGTLFLLLAGVSLALSERRNKEGYIHHVKRAAFLGAVSLSITAATWVYPHEGMITFGIIHCIALCVLIAPPFFRLGRLNVLLGLVLIVAGFFTPFMSTDSPFLFWLGIVRPDYTALDFYPIIPWLGVVLIGIYAGQSLPAAVPEGGANRNEGGVRGRIRKALVFAGRHSLAIYLIHQPIIIGLLLLARAALSGEG